MPITTAEALSIHAVQAVAKRLWALPLVARTLSLFSAASVCLLLAAAASLGQVVDLPAWLAALVRDISPASAAAFAGIALGQMLAQQAAGRSTIRLQTALGCAVILLTLVPQWRGLAALLANRPSTLPDHVSPLMALGLACGGLSLLRPPARWSGLVSSALLRWLPALVLTVLALLGIMSLVLSRQIGQYWFASFDISPGPAVAFLLLTAGLLRDRDESTLNTLREDFRISIMSLIVLTAVVVVTGIATFWAVQARLQESEQERLVQSAYRREMAFNYQLANASRLASDLAQSPAIAKVMTLSSAQIAASSATLNDELAAMWREEFTAIRFELAERGATLPSRGTFLPTELPGVALEQATDMHFELQWNDGLMAYAKVPVLQSGRALGWVISQQRLLLMTEQLFETADLGQHVEVRLCAPESATQAWCMPSQPGGNKIVLPLQDAKRGASAIALGIRGEQGTMVSTDERGTPVIDVFASVQRPLGLQLRQSIDTVVAPVREKLKQVFAVIGVMLVAGLVILNLQVRPLALRLVLNERRLSTVMSSVSDGIITTDARGRVTYLNRAAEAMTGWPMADAMGQAVAAVYSAVQADSGRPAASIVDQVLGGQAARNGSEVDLVCQVNGSRLPITDTVSLVQDRNNVVEGAVLVFHDATAARARSAAISYEASHDTLTGLVNRKEFERRLAALASADGDVPADPPLQHSLLYIDLDRFKQVNDSAGHAAGDELLRQVTRLMHKALRTSDVFARVGGDEFTVILPSCGPHDASRIANQIRQAVASYGFNWGGKLFHIGTSIGVVSFEPGGADLATLVSTADAACYRAKSSGRNNVQAHEGVLAAAA